MKVLVTGGAGFIGTHLCRRLLHEGWQVSVLDNFNPQIHPHGQKLPADLSTGLTLFVADVRDRAALHRALEGCDALVHLAAETGTGQSMYEVSRYEGVNVGGTAHLMDYLMNAKENHIQRIVVASSRAVYGEGKYRCETHGVVYPKERLVKDMDAGNFEPRCPHCASFCRPLPTDEGAPYQPTSFYGLTKQIQEQMVLLFAKARGITAYALRFQNVYGPGQSLSNPYTGVLAVFAGQARQGKPIYVFEDGEESRDFVYVEDVVHAVVNALKTPQEGLYTVNVGSGQPTTLREVAERINHFFGNRSVIKITGSYRLGDIRHNIADLRLAKELLDYEPRCSFPAGLQNFLHWAEAHHEEAQGYEASLEQMRQRGLMRG
ncbi:NAD-dependent epimerase/dehydratase family protein [Chthonomonas calidirosea]|uniref:NAD-dependent epimerase/dehydratase family protein n=1 Tax=Chthonomonas calidirosea TaxID=454171 RepID=UPI0006EC9D01|nr:SDR family NAD(P)-dependent oxidoreductase [Chthonomonas calidirosea]CEK19142.1 nucleoside-diphosphate-sugar epimerase [Chthonomonas calidirosea]